MAIIKLQSGEYRPIPVGEHVLQITNVTYDEDFGKAVVEFTNVDGLKHNENYALLDANGEINQKAQNAFTYTARTALNDYSVDEIDTDDLVGKFIRAKVAHDTIPHKSDPNKTVTFVHLNEKKPATAFDTKPTAIAQGKPKQTATAPKKEVSLDDIFK